MVGTPSFYINALNGVGYEPAELKIKADPSYIVRNVIRRKLSISENL